MSKLQRKTIAVTVLLSLLTLVGGLCYGNTASASTNVESMPGMAMEHCGDQLKILEQAAPMNGTVMPCCIDRHDNIPTVVPCFPQEKIKQFSQAVVVTSSQEASLFEQKTYASSPSPPPEPDILSSVIKIE